MAEIKLSSPSKAEVMLGDGLKMHHENLKNLDFENSGHIGFQKQLTQSQLLNIDAVSEKENTANKTIQIDNKVTDEQYPSAKAVFDAIEKHGDLELIESVTLEEDVVSITPTIAEKYKELFVFLKIPKAATVGGTKGRWMVYTKDGNGLLKHCICNQGNWLVSEYTSSTWCTIFHLQVFENYCRTDMYFNTAAQIDAGYTMGYNGSNLNGSTAPGVKLFNKYIDTLKIDFTSPNGTAEEKMRYLPAGTTYEIWGVRA